MKDELREEVFKILRQELPNIYGLKLYYFSQKIADRLRERGYRHVDASDQKLDHVKKQLWGRELWR